jgi:hypothetical protein
MEEPRGEPADPDPQRVRDALEVAERAEHPFVPVPERLGRPAVELGGDVGRETLRLAERVLGGRRRPPGGVVGVRHRRDVAGGPDPLEPLDAQGAVHPDPPPLVDGQAALRGQRGRTDARRPHDGLGRDRRPVGQPNDAVLDRV